MKRILQHIKSTPMLIVFLFICIFIFPGALVKAPSNEVDTFVTAVGIDVGDNDTVDVTLMYFLPLANQSFVETYDIVKSNGKNFADAIDNASLILGNEVLLSHVSIVVLGEEVINNNILSTLDYLLRDDTLTNSTQVAVSNIDAYTTLNYAKDLATEKAISLKDVLSYNGQLLESVTTTINSIYEGYFSPTKSSLISKIDIIEKEEGIPLTGGTKTSGEGSSESSSSSDSGGSESQSGSLWLFNQGESFVLKDGTKYLKLNKDEMSSLNFFKGDFNYGIISLENVNTTMYNDATISLKINKQSQNYKTKFVNGIPYFINELRLNCKVVEVDESNTNLQENKQIDLSSQLENLIEQQVKIKCSNIIQILKENKTDILGFYQTFYTQNRAKFKEYLKTLDDVEDFLNNIVFIVDVIVLPD